MGIDIVGFFKEHKEEILGGLVLLGGAALVALSDSDGGYDELTNGQKLDLSEAVDAVSWDFGDDIEYANASDGSVCFFFLMVVMKPFISHILKGSGMHPTVVIMKTWKMLWA